MNEAKYNIKDLFAENGSIEMVTEGGVVVQLTLDLLQKLVPPAYHDKEKQQPARLPNNAELAMFANCILEDRLNPYKKECWLVWVREACCYTPIIAAQSRMKKVMSLTDYEGWEWGYVLKDGIRQEQGGKAPLPDIVGLWGKVYRNNRKPYHHEMMRCDYKKGSNLTMCLKAHKDQAHRYAYADQLGNLNTDNEVPMMDFAEDETQEPEMGSQVVTSDEIKGGDNKEAMMGPVDGIVPESVTVNGKPWTKEVQENPKKEEPIDGLNPDNLAMGPVEGIVPDSVRINGMLPEQIEGRGVRPDESDDTIPEWAK